ncbi:hypothetical protein [Cellulosimicrobium sp. CUA-896]|uniref:hypothetical protein n=1 Tax=Cellulosimicrobium sp. CUA-896 TaxID=1517881 RepID=UPI00095AE125|nr:hypothetical protein [Cellulosimicrobium sp. CUA-896]OLT55459.1 hypothetical protein BJF88_06080 [Cellulosimicrobium sp. CUA-896]
MRWDALFDDLAAQLLAAERAELTDAVADLTRAEHATMTLVERLRGTEGAVGLDLEDGSRVTGHLREVAPEWVLVAEQARQHLVPASAVAAVTGVSRFARPDGATRPGGRARGLGLGHVLRALMRDRLPVQVRTRAGVHPGWIARVGKDHLDLEAGPGARDGARVVPWSALLCVSDTPSGVVLR